MPSKNKHIEHLEDIIFNDGYVGAKDVLTHIANIVRRMAGKQSDYTITTKWDGAPSIVAGIDPEDGRFFVATKSAFAKNPKLVKDIDSLQEYYGDQPGLYKKLAIALKYLPKLGITDVVQGDFMYDSDSIKKTTINGRNVIVFKPNTITYAVDADSKLGHRILASRMGIVFHTQYHGPTMQLMHASPIGQRSFGPNRYVWATTATLKDLSRNTILNVRELDKIKKLLAKAKSILSSIPQSDFDAVINEPEFKKFIKPYINASIRNGSTPKSPSEFINGFYRFYVKKIGNEINNLVKKSGKDSIAVRNRIRKLKAKRKFLETHKEILVKIFLFFKNVEQIKHILINRLNKADTIATFIDDGSTLKPTNPEGFVIATPKGQLIKLVDRMEFSKNNFNIPKSWD